MTAATITQNLPARTWNSLLKLAITLAVAAVLIVGSFAVGRSTADDVTTIVRDSSAPADVPPVATDASCGHTAHTPPC